MDGLVGALKQLQAGETLHDSMDVGLFSKRETLEREHIVIFQAGVLTTPWWGAHRAVDAGDVITHLDQALTVHEMVRLWSSQRMAPPRSFLRRLVGLDFLNSMGELRHIRLMPHGFDPVSDSLLNNILGLKDGLIFQWHLSTVPGAPHRAVMTFGFQVFRPAVLFLAELYQSGFSCDEVCFLDRVEMLHALCSGAGNLRPASTSRLGYRFFVVVVQAAPPSCLAERVRLIQRLAGQHGGVALPELAVAAPTRGTVRSPSEVAFLRWNELEEHRIRLREAMRSPISVRMVSPKHDGIYVERFNLLSDLTLPRVNKKTSGKRSVKNEILKKDLRSRLGLSQGGRQP